MRRPKANKMRTVSNTKMVAPKFDKMGTYFDILNHMKIKDEARRRDKEVEEQSQGQDQ